ncbi:ATP-binding protein [bacterium]|nr:ATP-binding protein [bacterium]
MNETENTKEIKDSTNSNNSSGFDVPAFGDFGCYGMAEQRHPLELKLIGNYLFSLYESFNTDERIKVSHFVCVENNVNIQFVTPKVIQRNELGMPDLIEDRFYAFASFDNKQCHISINTFRIAEQDNEIHYGIIKIDFINEEDTFAYELFRHLKKQSYAKSIFRNNTIRYYVPESIEIKKIADSGESLKDIFLPEIYREELDRFIQSILNYEKLKTGLRFLLCGEPGTGKTKSIRAVINAVKGKCTIFLTESLNDPRVRVSSLFRVANYFEPCLILLDDLDLLLGAREERSDTNRLGEFLQLLDGIENNKIFVLATTNSKLLVDQAASRPGRFDLILDYARMEKSNYEALVKQYAAGDIQDIFDEELIRLLHLKRLTGAFIVNLVKQVNIKHQLDADADLRGYAKRLIDFSYGGFYSQPKSGNGDFGFKKRELQME